MSETDTCRERLAKFCQGSGLDLGFGGFAPIVPYAICVDRAPGNPSRACGAPDPWPTHLAWDIFKPLPFTDGALDFCFSSHALEDAVDTKAVLREWLRVIKPGGHLVLFLPDERVYRAHCAANGTHRNMAHTHADFSLDYVKACLPPQEGQIVHSLFPVPNNAYSFDLVVRKL